MRIAGVYGITIASRRSAARDEATFSIVFFHQPGQRGKRVVGCLGDFRGAQGAFAEVLLVGVARVFVVMAIQAYLTVRFYGMRH